ncbi:hypothetical protein H4Q26_010126 [Puccinia striiformis f. sp. tritici PST-130]|nr:hypothetical protein H4Q26_010126 [Puccinia striiformis f. sp. tritici PST-130]
MRKSGLTAGKYQGSLVDSVRTGVGLIEEKPRPIELVQICTTTSCRPEQLMSPSATQKKENKLKLHIKFGITLLQFSSTYFPPCPHHFTESSNRLRSLDRGIAAENAAKHDAFEEEVSMWVFEDRLTAKLNQYHQRKSREFTDKSKSDSIINSSMPRSYDVGILSTTSIYPHICRQLREAKVIGAGAFAISLTKGVDEELGISCAALSGANIANEVALNKFSETTIGYSIKAQGELWQKLFHTPNFHVQIIEDRAGVSLCGALKNVVAVAAGFCDGLGWGNNAKAAIMRIGLLEMKSFSMEFFSGVKKRCSRISGYSRFDHDMFRRAKPIMCRSICETGKPFSQLETELLGGQKLQGVATAQELNTFLKAKGRVEGYPLFSVVYKIAFENLDPAQMTSHL